MLAFTSITSVSLRTERYLLPGTSGQRQRRSLPASESAKCNGVRARVVRVNVQTLAVEELVSYPSSETFILGTVALEVGNELLMGGIAGSDRIVRFPAATLPR